MSLENNTLLQDYATPFGTIPFSEIENSEFLPAINKAILNAEKEIADITDNQDHPTFENTVEALEYAGEQLHVIYNLLSNLNSANTSTEIQQIVKEASPLVSAHNNSIWQNEDLFKKVKEVYNHKESLELTEEKEILLDKQYKAFIRNGANLSRAEKKRFKDIIMQLSTLKLQFGENVLAETNAYELVITNEADLAGLPQSALDQAREQAVLKNKENAWIFTLQAPSFIPFMEHAENRKLREKLYKAYTARGNKGDSLDNKPVILEMVRLRAEMAGLLGYNSYADYVLEERMAGSIDTVDQFLEELLQKARPRAEKEVEEVKAYARKLDGLTDLHRWDWSYYAEKLRKERFAIDDELLRPYFRLENVLEGIFTTVNKLYGINFKKNERIPVYHPDVQAYQVENNQGDHVAVFYADFHPRESKRGGAWMTTYRDQMIRNGRNIRPHISIVCNFTPSTADKPSLLTFNEVLTLFHEFGHALHGMLADTVYPGLSGTGVYWDFVELPSQIFENWCYEKECLDLFARHYQTGETIPEEYIRKIKESSTFHEAYRTIRQLSFGLLDLNWYRQTSTELIKEADRVADFEQNAMASTELFPTVPGSLMSTQFSHIFAGGYAAGYYSYKWAEVLDADAFSKFRENGIFDRETATKFKDTVLSKGGSVHPMKLYKQFMGREPKTDALLERAGLA